MEFATIEAVSCALNVTHRSTMAMRKTSNVIELNHCMSFVNCKSQILLGLGVVHRNAAATVKADSATKEGYCIFLIGGNLNYRMCGQDVSISLVCE
jgi:hypothetical protein